MKRKIGHWVQELQCEVLSFTCNFLDREFILYMQEGHCCSMPSVIKFAKKYDDNVKQIQTFSGEEPDVCYVLRENNTWVVLEISLGFIKGR